MNMSSSQFWLPVDGLQEVMFYHNPAHYGFVATLQKKVIDGKKAYRQRCFQLSSLPDRLNNLTNTGDLYIGVNRFNQPNRRTVNLIGLTCCFVDLDTYRSQYCDFSPEKQAWALLAYCSDHEIPTPSLIIYSGNGLQVKWLFDSPLSSRALPRWNATQREFVEKLSAFGADPSARDASRMLRFVGSVNSKTGYRVQVLWSSCGDSPRRWSFDTLADEVLPLTRSKIRELQDEQKKAAKVVRDRSDTRAKQRSGLTKFNEQTLWWDRFNDLQILIRLRGYENGIPGGQRNNFLFLFANAVAWQDPKNFHQEVVQIARMYCPDYSQGDVNQTIFSVQQNVERYLMGDKVFFDGEEQDPRYRITNQRIIDALEITPLEERSLKTIISKQEKRARDRNRKRKFTDRETYLERGKNRFVEVLRLHQEGRSYPQIAEILGVSERTVVRDMKKTGGWR